MPLDRQAIGQALRQWILTSTALADNKVLFAFQPGPQPEWPFVVLNPTLATAPQGLYDEQQFGTGTLTRIERRTVTVSVNVYGAQGEALAIADQAADGLESQAVLAILEAAGLAPIDKGQPRNLSELEETQFVERYEFDVKLSAVATSAAEDVGQIAGIGVAGQLTPPTGPEASTAATIG